MCKVCDRIGQPHFITEVAGDEEVVWYPEGTVADDGTMTRNEWILKCPEPGELKQLYDALIYVGGLVISEDEIRFDIKLDDLGQFPPRITELAMLIMDVPRIKRDFAEVARSNKDKFRIVGGSSN
ncbi:MAG: hypothetical protein ABIQ04_01540 [Candidatus Saccharimonadales bacterium]